MSILITSTGRCGTKFLQTNLNLSEKFKVMHEIRGDSNLMGNNYLNELDRINKRFKRDNYIEVNGYLRRIAEHLEVEKKRIIVREPVELLESGYNRWFGNQNRVNELKKIIDLLNRDFIYLDRIKSIDNIEPISFNRMTNDIDYLYDIFLWCGINDVTKSKLKMSKINETIEYNHTPPDELYKELNEKCGWFIEKYSKWL